MDAFIGEIRAFAISFIPEGWLACNGQVVSVNSYQALYSLLGNAYGGSASKGTFGLPDLQGQAPIGLGTGTGLTPRIMGKAYGASTVTLTSTSQLPPHQHTMNMQIPAAHNLTTDTQHAPTAASSWLARTANVSSDTASVAVPSYTKNTSQTAPTMPLHPLTIGFTGGNANGVVTAHENHQPYLPMTFCICWNGIYPDFN